MYMSVASPGLGAVSPASVRSRLYRGAMPARAAGAARPQLFIVRGVPSRGVGNILRPDTNLVETRMVNWTPGPVTVPDLESQMAALMSQIAGDVAWKLQAGGPILDPAACTAKLANEAAGVCAIYPDLCKGVDLQGMFGGLCSEYGDFVEQQRDTVQNQSPAVYYSTPQTTPSMIDARYGTTASAPIVAAQNAASRASNADSFTNWVASSPGSPAAAPPPAPAVTPYSSAAPASSGGAQTLQAAAAPLPPVQSSTPGFSLDSLPSWALPAAIAAGVAFFMFGGRR